MTDLNIYSKEQTDSLLGNKQNTLVSGTSIKTINGTSVLGSGDITVGGGVTVDSTITQGSTNPVQNGAIYTALQTKADTSDVPVITAQSGYYTITY